MKGFITGSLVTLGVVGLVAALKDSDVLDFGDDFDCADYTIFSLVQRIPNNWAFCACL
ncbi:MAG: hypothetical protein IJP61_07955 [Treponema sp.]|nr:hypothetical protein [Treponema sp.]